MTRSNPAYGGLSIAFEKLNPAAQRTLLLATLAAGSPWATVEWAGTSVACSQLTGARGRLAERNYL